MPHTLITGASKGIGRCLVNECAKRSHNLLLLDVDQEGLEETAGQVRASFNVEVITYTLDITSEEALENFFEWSKAQDILVNMLINNAGMGLQGNFEDLSLEENLTMMNLNNRALVTLNHMFIPQMKRFDKAYIMNVGSIASFLKFPYKAVYSGTKNFVLAFSNALNEELKKDDISVSCLCPGPTITNPLVEARTTEQGWKARILTLSAEQVAKYGIKGLLKGKSTIIPGKANRIIIFLIKHLPSSFSTKMTKRMFANSQYN